MKVSLLALFPLAVKALDDTMRCMNYYGLETERRGLVCDWVHDYWWYIDRMVTNLGVNTIRLPFSYELVKQNELTVMDQVIAACHSRGLRVILDWHRTWSSHQGPTPEEGITMDEFIATWILVLERYPTVFGIGIYNEIQTMDFEYTNNMHHKVITAIEAKFPGKFTYFAGCPYWGGNCSDMHLEDMPTWNRTYIEVHKYIFSGASNPEDWDMSMPARIPSDHWFVGEVGWKHQEEKQRTWAEVFLAYLTSRNINNICAWTIAHSGDTDGWWKDDCDTFDWEKASLLKSFWSKSLKLVRTFTVYTRVLLRRGDRSLGWDST